MPGGYGTDESTPWGSSGDTGYVAPVSTGTPNFGGQGTGGANQPPPQVDTTPVINNTQTTSDLTGRSAALQTAADESANKYLTSIAEMATDEYGRTRNIYDLETNDPLLTFDDGKVVRDGGFKRDDQGQYYVPPFEGVGDKGQLLSDLERMQLAALKMGHKTSLGDPVHGGSQFESGLGSLIVLDSEGNPQYTDEGELMYTGLGGAVSDNWNEILGQYDDPTGYGQGDMMQDIVDDYYAGFDQRWSGMDDWDWNYYGGGRPETENILLGGDWRADPRTTEMASMGEMQPIYGEELAPGREANWLYLTGIPQFRDQIIS